MGRQVFTRQPDRVIAAIAARQHGVVARWQLLAAGLSEAQIRTRIESGRLHELHRGVYLSGHAIPPRYAREQAALLACGDGAVLSHESAASLWKLLPYPAPGDVRVTIPRERTATRPRIEVHRASITERDLRRRHCLALTSPPRTLLDLASHLEPRGLEAVIAEAQYRRLATDRELRDQLERNPRARGAKRLRAVLDLTGGPRRTRSGGEREMLALLRRSGLDGYATNAKVHGYEVDVWWPRERLAIEVDGYDAHSGSIAFERDRLKIATLNAHGITVMPVTGRQLRGDPDGVLDRIKRALRR